MKKLYRVSWKLNKKLYHGQWDKSKDLIQAWVDYGNSEYPKIKHYLESK